MHVASYLKEYQLLLVNLKIVTVRSVSGNACDLPFGAGHAKDPCQPLQVHADEVLHSMSYFFEFVALTLRMTVSIHIIFLGSRHDKSCAYFCFATRDCQNKVAVFDMISYAHTLWLSERLSFLVLHW